MITRALVVGLGSIGQRHLRLLRQRLPDTEILVLRHSGGGDPVALADGCTTSLDEACAFAPQIAIIASPAPFHAATGCALARVGTSLLVEKPLAATASEAAPLIAAAEAAKVHLQVGYNLRFLESLSIFRAAILEGRIGRVVSVRAEVGQYLPDWRPERDFRDCVSARRELGGGALLELSHEIDFLCWIFGEVRSVRAWTGQAGGFDIDVEDVAHLLLQFSGSAVGSAADGPLAVVSLDLLRRDATRRCVAIGEAGTLSWDGIASRVMHKIGEREDLLFEGKVERDATYAAQLDTFLVEATRAHRSDAPYADGAASLAVLQIVDAARRSSDLEGTVVKLVSGAGAIG